MSSPPPPLPLLEPPDAANTARQRLARRHRFASVSLPNIRALLFSKKQNVIEEPASPVQVAEDPATIKLNLPSLSSDDQYQDKYQWAIVYEHQRGLFLFSVPYFSSNSLLPSDPAPFTVPSAISLERAHQPYVSLKEFPLPDGNWQWVSNSWMVDMRSDSGEVQHDGFEYNWMFRRTGWRSQVGPLSAGGWVRRRRWVRLMMRPGKERRLVIEEDDGMNGASSIVVSPSLRNSWNGWDKRLSVTPAPSLFTNVTGRREAYDLPEVWQGKVNEDYHMCREVLRVSGSDGAKLEIWKRWLGLAESEEPSDAGKGKQKAEPDDGESFKWSDVPPLEYVTAVLRAKFSTILKDFFIFPESRRAFIELLFQANVFDQVSGFEHGMTLVKALEFWSLNNELHLLPLPSPNPRPSKSLDIE